MNLLEYPLYPIDRHLPVGEASQMPDDVTGTDNTVPVCNQIAIMCFDIVPGSRRLTKNAGVPEMSIGDEAIRETDCCRRRRHGDPGLISPEVVDFKRLPSP